MVSIITHRLSTKNTFMKLKVVSLLRALEKPQFYSRKQPFWIVCISNTQQKPKQNADTAWDAVRRKGVLEYLFIFIFFTTFFASFPYEKETSVTIYLLMAMGDNNVPGFFSRLCV